MVPAISLTTFLPVKMTWAHRLWISSFAASSSPLCLMLSDLSFLKHFCQERLYLHCVDKDLTKLTANCFYHSLTSFICRRYLGKSPWMLFLNKNKLAWGWKQYVLCTICIYRNLWRSNSLLNYDKFYRRLKICLLKIIDVYNTLRNKISFLAKLTSWIHCFEFRAQSHIYYRILISH